MVHFLIFKSPPTFATGLARVRFSFPANPTLFTAGFFGSGLGSASLPLKPYLGAGLTGAGAGILTAPGTAVSFCFFISASIISSVTSLCRTQNIWLLFFDSKHKQVICLWNTRPPPPPPQDMQFFNVQFCNFINSRSKATIKVVFFVYLKVSRGAKIRNRYNQVPHLTQDTNGKVTNS